MFLNSLKSGHGFVSPVQRIFISLLLTPLLCASCARPGALASGRTSPLMYVAVGDSTGIGLGARDGGGYVARLFARIEQKRPGSTLINLSAAGATTLDAIDKQLPRLTGTPATLVTVCVGTNDLLRGREAKQFAEDYETLVVRLRRPGRVIVVANLPDITSAPAMKGRVDESLTLRLGQFNKAIEDIAGRHGVSLVDLNKSSGGLLRSHPEYFSSDGLHPSDLGYARWAEVMWAVVEQAIDE
jgi:lysophospholipase L1-like esterase